FVDCARTKRERLRSARDTAGYSGGRSLIDHLAMPDWAPSTATPESCRWAVEPPSKSRTLPFGGAIDIVRPVDRPAPPEVARATRCVPVKPRRASGARVCPRESLRPTGARSRGGRPVLPRGPARAPLARRGFTGILIPSAP